MFDLETSIASWRREMSRAGIRREELLNELESHLREEILTLTAAGATNEDAFRDATKLLGDGSALKKEFARSGVAHSYSWRDNPWSLNLIAAWFIIVGLNAVCSLETLFYNGFPYSSLLAVGFELILCSQLLIGIGLFRRKDLCRHLAVKWTRWALILFNCSVLYTHVFASVPSTGPKTSLAVAIFSMTAKQELMYHFLFVPLPAVFCQIISLLNVGIFVWAYYLLTRTRARELFQHQGA